MSMIRTLAENFAPFLADSENLIVPALVQFELYKWCLREKDEAAGGQLLTSDAHFEWVAIRELLAERSLSLTICSL